MDEREAEIRRWVASGDIVDRHDAAHLLALLDAERRSHSLPVLRTCGDCGWYGTLSYACRRDDALRTAARNAAPPDWCPLRANSASMRG